MTQPVRLLLVRHAHIEEGAARNRETPLSARGQAQADWLAPALGGEPIAALLSSPFARAQETAARLAGSLGIEPAVEEGLAEFEVRLIEEAEGRPVEQSHLAVWHPEHRGRTESLADFQTRVTALLTAVVLRASEGDALVVVTHAGVIDAAVRWALGLTSRNAWLAETCIPHASVTEIEHWPRGRHPEGAPRYSVLRRLGDVSALPPDLVSE